MRQSRIIVADTAFEALSTTPMGQAYRERVASGQLTPDPAQEKAAAALAILAQKLSTRAPDDKPSLWRRITSSTPPLPQGVYLWGEVGRGKTMLMDMFFQHAAWEPKKRVHFHSFMRDMHVRIHQWRSSAEAQKQPDPIPPLAAAIAAEAKLLCFDEMQVHDVTDAMLIRRLFEELQKRGVVMVITSNRPPADLYLNGLQRGQFMPFIDRIHHTMHVVELESATDYRRRQLSQLKQTYFSPLGKEASDWLSEQFANLTHGQQVVPLTIELPGRKWHVAKSAGDIAKTDFAILCEQPLGASDYMELARHISTLLLNDIPILRPDNRNAAKRFVTLIDVLYEAKVKLLCTAAAQPDALYPKGDGSFEFSRTASRLIEMQSDAYRALPWQRPESAKAATQLTM
jgi:cell division protein ZapE